MTEHKNVYRPFPPFNRFNHVSCQRRGDEQIFGYVQSKHLVFSVGFSYFRQILQWQCYFVAKFTYITKRSNVETINIKYAVGVFCQ